MAKKPYNDEPAAPAGALVVRAKGDRRRRAGRTFTRDETVIPLAELTEAERAAIEGDDALIVTQAQAPAS